MEITAQAVHLAGFTLGHAAWSVCDASGILRPLALVDRDGEREVVEFEGDDIAAVVEEAQQHYAEWYRTADCWAFVREGTLQAERPEDEIEVLVIDFAGQDMPAPLTVIQRFEPFGTEDGFRLVGAPEFFLDEEPLEEEETRGLLEALLQGVGTHGKARELWESWLRGQAA